jgi:hypothetical protein
MLREASRLETLRIGELVVDAKSVAHVLIPLRAHSVCLLELVPV